MSAYLSMFKTLASEKLAAEDAVGIIKTARAHAGGKAKAEKALVTVPANGEGAAEFAEFFKNGHRLFIELGDNDLTDWMQITPGTGRWNHPKFGLVEITDATLERFVDNFKQKVYQEHIPVDAEHKTKLSGAFGYYRDMKVGHEGKPGVWAKIELTERGKELLAAGGFRYFSPEFYEEWEEPASGQIFQDVITGGAFTTRPFFKDKALEPVVMSEFCMPEMDMAKMEANEAADFVSDICEMVYDGFTDEQINNVLKAALAYAHAMAAPMDNSGAVSMSEGKEPHVAETENKEPQGFSEEQLREFTELKTANETLSKQFSEALETNKALSSRVEAMETADRTRRFKEVVTGRGGANDGGPQWFGEPDKHVSMLNTLAKTFGEDSEEFNAYVESQNAAAKALADSPIMRETGSSSPEPAGGIEQKVDALVKQYMERDPKLTRETALPRVFAENPAVYAEYNKEFMAKAKKGE